MTCKYHILSFFVTLLALTFCYTACTKYDDSDLYSKYNSLDSRVSKLEAMCQDLNRDIASLRTIVNALEQNDGITSIDELYEGGEIVGYRINLRSGNSFTIFNGEQGKPGADADKAPQIGIKQDSDGVWYWTLNGEWMTDDYGNRVIASGRNGNDGKDGKDGQDGKDGANGTNGTDGTNGSNGITPLLRIVDGYWQISYDNGSTWTTVGKATGENGKDGTDGQDGMDGQSSVFTGIDTGNADYAVITLSNGSTIMLPRYKSLSLTLDVAEDVTVMPGVVRDIPYAIEGASEDVQIETIAEGVKATVVKTGAFSGKIAVTIGETLETEAKVLVFVVDKGQTVMQRITFENSVITVTENTAGEISYTGGEFTIDLMTNAAIEILIPSEASSWITLPTSTKAITHVQKVVDIAANEGGRRSATITVKDKYNPVSKDVTILQQCHPDYYESSDYSKNGVWKKLQAASTDGHGLNIVFLGDAYTDVMIADGTYDNDMKRAMDHFFEVEPYASMRDMFNCYQVYAVSKNNNYNEGSSTVFQCQFGTGTRITGYNDKVRMYAQKVTEIENGNWGSYWYTMIDGEQYTHYSDIPGGMLCVVILNSTRYAGTCSISTDGTAVAYCPLHERDDWFAEVIHHEAGGHGFARLADEYDGSYSALDDNRKENLLMYKEYGFYQNVDITKDPEAILWRRFLSDSRYSGETGIYEGGYLCNTGVWRSSENSIMRYNTGGFNAPSREIIYRRAMELSKGSSYTYNFEDFAAFDAKNRKNSAPTFKAMTRAKNASPDYPYGEPEITFSR